MRPSILFLLPLCIFLALALNVQASSERITVEVTGTGSTVEAAKFEAVRQALQLTLKQLIVVERSVSDTQVLRDKVMSTMNGYIDRFEELGVSRDGKSIKVFAKITVSKSRVINFLGITEGDRASVDGKSLWAEQNRRAAQSQAEILQERARAEIYDRIFRGFPSQSLDVTVRKMQLAQDNHNKLAMEVAVSFKKEFVKSLISTINVLTDFQCPDRPRHSDRSNYSDIKSLLTAVGGRNTCRRPVAVTEYANEDDVICLGGDKNIRCFELLRGNYCASCDLENFSSANAAGGFFHAGFRKDLIIFGRFIDAQGRTAHANGNCLTFTTSIFSPIGRSGVWDSGIQVFIDREKPMFAKRSRLLTGIDLDPRVARFEVETSMLRLQDVKYFVAVAGLVPQERGVRNDHHKATTSMVPDEDNPTHGGCTLLDRAVQYQMMMK